MQFCSLIAFAVQHWRAEQENSNVCSAFIDMELWLIEVKREIEVLPMQI